ncbi:MAG: hypothetical protein M1820_005977 [Bogoriella megaspora]|nr:MAG: hypothetical protein M1820_005977 [Bogoriella megaspora]
MSMTGTNSSSSKLPNKSASNAETAYTEERESTDAIVDKISKLIPPTPYVPSIPQDEPKYHHYSLQSSRAWLHNTPFHEDESPNLQYMTFLYQDPNASSMQLHNLEEFDISRTRTQTTAKPNGVQSGTTTPFQSSGPKKKITFGDYKKKQVNGGTSVPAGEPDKKSAAKVPTPDKDDRATTSVKVPSRPLSPAQEVDHKLAEKNAASPQPQASPRHESPPPAKRRRISPPPVIASGVAERTSSGPPEHDPLDLPSSPVTMDLPANPISIDMPSFFLKEYSADDSAKSSRNVSPNPQAAVSGNKVRNQGTKAADSPLPNLTNGVHRSHASSTSSDSQPLIQQAGKLSHSHPVKKPKTPNQEPEPASQPVIQKSQKKEVNGEKRVQPSKLQVKINGEQHHEKKTSAPVHHAHPAKSEADSESIHEGPRMRRILTLKIRTKGAKKTLSSYLRTPPKPWPPDKLDLMLGKQPEKPRPRASTVSEVHTRPSVDRKKARATPEKTSEKRPRTAEDSAVQGRPQKRLKAPATDSHRETATPVPPTIRSPTSNPPSAQKHLQSTPRKELKSAAMQRVASSESVNTPHASVSTPPVSGTSLPDHLPSLRQHHANEEARQAWKAEETRLSQLGTSLKHSAENKSGIVSLPPRLSAIKMLESFLCFMLAFTCTDQANDLASISSSPSTSRPLVPPFKSSPWLSLPKFAASVLVHVKPYPHLYGLAQQLNMCLSAHLASLAAQVPPKELPNPGFIADIMKDLPSVVASAAHRLPVQDVWELYPETCNGAARRRRAGTAREGLVTPGEYAGVYGVPITVQTPVLHAVRFGVALLGEWVKAEGVTYEMELKL